MGIRINKTLGWGVEIEKSQYSDVINEDYRKVNFRDYIEYLDSLTAGKSATEKLYDDSEKALIRGLNIDLNKVSHYSVINIIEDEYDDDSKIAIIIVPVSEANTWNRSDDAIDYYESIVSQKPPENSIKYLDTGIFPWNGIYMDKRTGKNLSGKQADRLYFLRNISSADYELDVLDKFASDAGFKDYHDYKENIAPYVPQVIRNIISYVKPFKENNGIVEVKDLRPMIATYWA